MISIGGVRFNASVYATDDGFTVAGFVDQWEQRELLRVRDHRKPVNINEHANMVMYALNFHDEPSGLRFVARFQQIVIRGA